MLKKSADPLASRSTSDIVALLEHLEWSRRREAFLCLCGEDVRKAAQVLAALPPPRALQSWCEISLAAFESDHWRSVEAGLAREMERQSCRFVESVGRSAYTIYAKGNSGVEHCVSAMGKAGFRVSASTTTFPGATSVRRTEFVSFEGRPLWYGVELGEEEAVRASFNEGRVAWRVKLADGVIEKNITVSEDVSVLDNFVWHHFGLLVEKAFASGSDHLRLNLFVPSTGRESAADLRYCGKRELASSLVAAADYYQITLADKVAVEVWTDELRRPLIIRVDSQGLSAVRADLQTPPSVLP